MRRDITCLALAVVAASVGSPWPLHAADKPGMLITNWTQTTALPVPRYNNGVAIVGKHIYVIGGHSGGGAVNDVYYAEIVAPGKLGAWKTTAVLPVPVLCSPTAVAVGRRLYVIGGDSGVKEVGVPVRYGDVADDGSVAQWQEGPRLPEGCSVGLGRAVICGNAVYNMGGWYNRRVTRAAVQANDELGPWESLGNLPCNLMCMGAGVAGNTLVLVGGARTNGKAEENCYWAKAGEGNRLREDATPRQDRLRWRMTEPLPEPNMGFATAQKGDLLFTLGGTNVAVWATRILPDEGITEWTAQRALPHAASYVSSATAVCDAGYIYLIGGLVETKDGGRCGWNEVWVGEVKE
jgi:hypothetical protein